MSVRIRAILVIVFTNLIILLFSVSVAIRFVRSNVETSIETDLATVADIANHFISAELESLKLKAADVARNLEAAGENDWPGIMAEWGALYSDFIGMTILRADGETAAFAGNSPAPREILNDKYIQRALSGEIVLSSTRQTARGVVFYLAVPVAGTDGAVLVITLPGMYFSQLMSTFVIWETGHIFIDDSDGYVIANIREEWVQNRFNFIELSKTDSDYEGIAAVVGRMIRGETGIGRFSIAGVPRICAYRPVAGSETGWCLGVVAPLPESPVRNIDRGLLAVAVVGIFLGIIAALIASDFIKKPFEEIAALKEEAEANSRSKSVFLANMSHEMRTPLNAVIGLSQLTLDGKIRGEERENTEKVYTAGVTLLGIINDILDISKIESGKFELAPINYDVPSLINDAITLNSMRVGEKPIKFTLRIDETLPSRLFGDDLRIKQIFNNLLSNAFKYTKAGTVDWHVSWEKDGDDVWLVSQVADTGIGIRKEDMGKLFQNYSQVDTASHRKIEGTGLGLALTKHMVELMSGTMSVESEYGKGSVFSFRIKQGMSGYVPIGPVLAKSLMNFKYLDQRTERHTRLVRLRLPYARVLVVDDVLPNLAVVKGIMKPYGMQVDCVGSGEEAVRLIREGVRYNAIFMDHMMPGMDGIETTRIIRNDIGSEYAKTVPIIALTANAIRGSEEVFLDSGFQAFLSKPIDIVQMDAVIRQWVRDREQEKSWSEKDHEAPPVQSHETGTIPGMDLEQALEQFAGDEESLIEVLRVYADQTRVLVERIKTVNPANLPAYMIDVHGIKGTSRNIYAEKAGSLAEALERAARAKDFAFVDENNPGLIDEIERLARAINTWLASKTTSPGSE